MFLFGDAALAVNQWLEGRDLVAGRPQQGAPDGPDASWQLAMHRPRERQECDVGQHQSQTCCLIARRYSIHINCYFSHHKIVSTQSSTH